MTTNKDHEITQRRLDSLADMLASISEQATSIRLVMEEFDEMDDVLISSVLTVICHTAIGLNNAMVEAAKAAYMIAEDHKQRRT